MFRKVHNHYLIMTGTVTAEELFARLLFLGVPLWLGHKHLSHGLFLALFFVGNSIWAAVHIMNYKDPKERRLLRTAPQFVAGVFFTVIFINFGFFGGLVVHLAYNNLLFATMRRGIFNIGEVVAIVWHGIIVALSGFCLMYIRGKSPLDMTYWLDHNATSYRIPGWTAWDYAWGVLMVCSLLYIIADLMLFDLYCGNRHRHVFDNLLKALYIIGFSFAGFFGLQALGTPFEMRIAVMALALIAIVRTSSGSGMARAFWIGIPWMMVLLYATLALGFASPIWLILFAVALVEAVDDVIRIWDRKREERLGLVPMLVDG
jgi:hypothetical protein